MFSPSWPSTASRWYAALLLTLGAIVAWATCPRLWPMGPFGAARRVWAIAAQESGFNPDASGDAGASIGILQYNDAKADWYGEGWRSSPFLSGFAFRKYWLDAPWPWLWRIWLPGVGVYWVRYAWVKGYAGDPPSLADVRAWQAASDPRSIGGYLAGAIVTLPLTVATIYLVLRAIRRKGRR